MINGLFVSLFKIDMEEAEKPMVEYNSIEDIFTRALKPGMRNVASDFVSPADGVLSQRGPSIEGKGVQAKGLDYSLQGIVFGQEVHEPANLDSFATVYLAPHNYHRVHSPVSGNLKKIRYIPGELWPVNEPFVRFMPNLFVRNERLVFDIETKSGGKVYAVMVGALNVGRIESPFLDSFFTNDYFAGNGKPFERSTNFDIKAGDELGTFMLGSTVVLVLDDVASKEFKLQKLASKRSIRMGDSLIGSEEGC